MYERSAIVLERYFDQIFGWNKVNNLRKNYKNYNEMIKELKEYQIVIREEEKVINKFDEIAREIQSTQSVQQKLCLSNQRLEEERNRLFNSFDENPNIIESKLEKIENAIYENNSELRDLRVEHVKALVIFTERQKERNKWARNKRVSETNHMNNIKVASQEFASIDIKDIQKMKKFVLSDKETIKAEIVNLMLKNGKNEKVGFDSNVIELAVEARIGIAEREAECYIMINDRLKKLLEELETDNLKLAKHEKTLRDVGIKLAFLEAEKEYIVRFLDNERMTAISGKKAHIQMMEEARKNFKIDIHQIDNLYELILREISGKPTKKAYNDLYNKSYLSEIEQKEKFFEQEVNSIKINMGTVINSNYWRIEGIKNVYEVFEKEVTEKFDKDLSEYKVVNETEDTPIMQEIKNIQKQVNKQKENLNKALNNNNTETEEDNDEYTYLDTEYEKYSKQKENSERFDEDEYDEEYEEEQYEDEDNYEEDDEFLEDYSDEDNYDEEEIEDEYEDDEYDEEYDNYDDEYDDEEYDELNEEDYYDDDEYEESEDEEDYYDENNDEYDEEDEDNYYDEDDEDEEFYKIDDDNYEIDIDDSIKRINKKGKRRKNKKGSHAKEKRGKRKDDDDKGLLTKIFKNKK